MTPLHANFEELVMKDRTQLHLVDASGSAVSPAIRGAVESAFHWAIRTYPNFDKAKIADWAEVVAASMQVRGDAIQAPERYAQAALKGKVRDWLRTGSAREQSHGMGRDLERIGGVTGSFQGVVDRKILFEQLEATLTDRDSLILLMLRDGRSAQEIAAHLKTSYPAARKAIQRFRERVRPVLSDTRRQGEEGHGSVHLCQSKG